MNDLTQTIFLIFAIAIYFLPSIVGRNCKKSSGISLLNLLLGWTLLGWVIAMIWAVSGETVKKIK